MVLNGAINEALRKHKESSELCLKASGKLQRRGDILSWASNVSSQMAPSLKYSHVTKPHLGWEKVTEVIKLKDTCSLEGKL